MNERVERILANAKRAVETGLAETDSQQVYELAERMSAVTELAHDMWPRLVDAAQAMERLERSSWRSWSEKARTRACAWCGVPEGQAHAGSCPFAVLDKWKLRGVWKGDEEPQEEVTQ